MSLSCVGVNSSCISREHPPKRGANLRETLTRLGQVIEPRHRKVVLDARLTEVFRLFAAGGDEATDDERTVVFGLRVAKRVCRRFLGLRTNMRDAEPIAPNHRVPGEYFGRQLRRGPHAADGQGNEKKPKGGHHVRSLAHELPCDRTLDLLPIDFSRRRFQHEPSA